MSAIKTSRIDDEVTILARVLGNDEGELPPELARYILTIGFSDQDKARMYDLAARNQEGQLSPPEAAELLAFGKAGDVLAILKSRARRTLGVQARALITT